MRARTSWGGGPGERVGRGVYDKLEERTLSQPHALKGWWDLLARRAQLVDDLTARMLRHVNLPQFLGSGSAKLEHKVKSMMFLFWMMASPPRHLSILEASRSLVSFTTDMGTELGLAEFEAWNLVDVLPPWMFGEADSTPGLQPDFGFEGDVLGGGVCGVQAARGERVFGPAVSVAGMMHIIHNLSWFADVKLNCFKDWLDGLKSVVTLLHYHHNRRRYVFSCIIGGPYEGQASRFKGGVPIFTEWRWGSIVHLIELLIPFQYLLKSTFSAFKFTNMEKKESAQDRPLRAVLPRPLSTAERVSSLLLLLPVSPSSPARGKQPPRLAAPPGPPPVTCRGDIPARERGGGQAGGPRKGRSPGGGRMGVSAARAAAGGGAAKGSPGSPPHACPAS